MKVKLLKICVGRAKFKKIRKGQIKIYKTNKKMKINKINIFFSNNAKNLTHLKGIVVSSYNITQ